MANDFQSNSQPLITIVNGATTSSIAVDDRGLAYGDGLFETMRFEVGQIPYLSFHLDRLFRDSSRLALNLSREALTATLTDVLQQATEAKQNTGLLKVIVTRASGKRGYGVQGDESVNIIAQVFPAPDYSNQFAKEGVAVYLCDYRLPINPPVAGIKHLNKLDYVMASLEWNSKPFQEAILCDSGDRVVEASSRNIFIVRDDKLLTPRLNNAGVAGVMREIIIQNSETVIARAVTEAELSIDDVLSADEVFLTNSVTGIWPVKEIMGKSYNNNYSISRALQAWLQADWQQRLSVSHG